MFKKAFLILSASAILATGVFGPTATLAQLPGPPPLPGPAGPPPGLGGAIVLPISGASTNWSLRN